MAKLSILKGSVRYTVADLIDLVQECMDSHNFAMMSMDIENWRVQNAAVIRDEVLKLFFPSESAVIVFHKKRQANGERPEVYTEHKKLLFVAAELAWQKNDHFDFNVLDFKQPLICRFSP